MTFKRPRRIRKKFYYHGRTDSDEYKKWRAAVYKRDRRTCQFPGCGSKRKIQIHHIKRWVDYPSLRYNLNNGICLCNICHGRIHGHEDSYAMMFMRIIIQGIKQ